MAWVPAGRGRLLLVLLVMFGLGHSLHLKVIKSNKFGENEERGNLVRHRREWIIPPVSIREEEDNSWKNPIAKIQTDRQLDSSIRIRYQVTGMGVTEPPLGIFYINERTGELNVTGIVDREVTKMFYLKGYAKDQYNRDVEPPIDLRVRVLDINDNAPVFTEEVFIAEIEELSAAKTVVMRLNATDADEPNTVNTKLAYRILSQEPGGQGLFIVIKDTGEVLTTEHLLDREQQSSYTLVVEVKDNEGREGAQVGKGVLKIKVKDVNDNIPYLEKEEYQGSVEENTANVEILRMKALDDDEEFTDNWLANFTIISGNEDGYFEIVRDSQTNEGILMMVKEADYEVMQNAELKVVVSNQAEYHHSIISSGGGGGGGGGAGKTIPIKVSVKNIREGPVFRPRKKNLAISEGKRTVINQVIGSYQATDGDTGKIAKNVKYAKEYDPDNWFIIDPITAEIKLSKIPDRESIYVVNGTYLAKILAISEDMPGKTATGTIAIEVEDENDSCPTLVNPVQTICHTSPYVNLTAVDRDDFPNGAPFTFTVIDKPVGIAKLWTLGKKDDVSVQLIPQDIWPGSQKIQVMVTDNQGLSCPEVQVLQLTVCTCEDGIACSERLMDSSAALGAGAIGLMILACLLLLLLPLLLLLCYCGPGEKGFMAIPDGTEATIVRWNNEGAAPEDMAIIPPPIISTGAATGEVGSGARKNDGFSSMKQVSGSTHVDQRWEESRGLLTSAEYLNGGTSSRYVTRSLGALGSGSGSAAGAAGAFVGFGAGGAGALSEEYLKSYFQDKAMSFAHEEDTQPAKDCILIYAQETESLAGSVDCCSFIESEFDDDYLDDLGIKFKALAEICHGTTVSINEQANRYKSYEALTNEVLESDAAVELDVAQEEETLGDQNVFNMESTFASSTSQVHVSEPAKAVNEGVVTDQSFASSRYIHEPMIHGNVLVTEKSYTVVPTVRFEPVHQQNMMVTERVIRPASSLHRITDIADGQNVMVTERMIKSDRGISGYGDVGEHADSKYLLVTERVLGPSSGTQASMSIPDLSVGQNVLVTERQYTPISGAQDTVLIPVELSGGQNMVENITFTEGGVQGQARFNLLEELPPSSNTIGKSTSRVTKYSTVQYTRS